MSLWGCVPACVALAAACRGCLLGDNALCWGIVLGGGATSFIAGLICAVSSPRVVFVYMFMSVLVGFGLPRWIVSRAGRLDARKKN